MLIAFITIKSKGNINKKGIINNLLLYVAEIKSTTVVLIVIEQSNIIFSNLFIWFLYIFDLTLNLCSIHKKKDLMRFYFLDTPYYIDCCFSRVARNYLLLISDDFSKTHVECISGRGRSRINPPQDWKRGRLLWPYGIKKYSFSWFNGGLLLQWFHFCL